MRKILCLLLVVCLIFAFGACKQNNTGDQAQVTPTPTATLTPTPTATPTATPTPAQNEIVVPTPNPSTPVPGQGKLKDGTYDAEGDAWAYGKENASVEIKNDKITKITLRRLTTDNQEVNYEEWTGAEVEGKVRPNLKQFRQDIAKGMIEKQSYNVDAIAGATVSSNNWKLAVSRALEKAAK